MPSAFMLGKITGSDDTLLALVAPLVTCMTEARYGMALMVHA
ncbi:MAG: hypothetical protein ACKPKO_11120 [Candidatus Fonsibacter sp.]